MKATKEISSVISLCNDRSRRSYSAAVSFAQLRNLLTVCCFASLVVSCSGFMRSALQIEAKVIYNMGGPQPVARTSFYLIDVDPLTIRADDPVVKRSRGGKDLSDAELLSEATFLLFAKVIQDDKVTDDNAKRFLGIIEVGKSLWGPHLVNETRTDFDGKATFADLKPGSYWLLGMTETRKGFCLWDLNVQINRGENKVLLDQHNALSCR